MSKNDHVLYASSESFNIMIVKEVAHSIISAISAIGETLELVFSVTTPHRPNEMVSQAGQMIKAFMCKTSFLCTVDKLKL